jgi:small subunit ribosomal protein S5
MEHNTAQKNNDSKGVAKRAPRASSSHGEERPRRGGASRGGKKGGPSRRGNDRRGAAPERVKPEFDHKIIDTRRVTRVVSGGRRFSFSITLVAGDRKGRVGVGVGKAGDTALAIEKAMRDAKKNMVTIKRTKEDSIVHAVDAKVGSSRLTLKPAPGRGIVAGSAVRTVCELAGIKDVGAKIYSRSKNKLGIARAAVKALEQLG